MAIALFCRLAVRVSDSGEELGEKHGNLMVISSSQIPPRSQSSRTCPTWIACKQNTHVSTLSGNHLSHQEQKDQRAKQRSSMKAKNPDVIIRILNFP